MERIAGTPKQLGAILRRFRRKAGMSQTVLGQKTQLRQATISTMESGEPGTELQTIIAALTALGLEIVVRERTEANKSIEELF